MAVCCGLNNAVHLKQQLNVSNVMMKIMITISEHDHELHYYQSGRVFSMSIIMDHQKLCYIIIDIYDMINMAYYRRIAIR